MKVMVDDRRIHVGTGSRPFEAADREAILFLHGAGMDHTVWVMPSRYFARHGYGVLAPDLPGHGRSDGPALDSVVELADWVAGLLDSLEVSRAIVVGHSMGSLIAYTFAAQHSDRTAAMVLFGTSAPMPVTDALLDAAADDDHAAFEMANTWSHSFRGSLGGNPVPGMFMLRSGERLLERSRAGVYSADLRACDGFDPNGLPLPGVPTTVVVGTEDKMAPMQAGRAVAERLGKSARVRTLEGSGHSMMSECPNEVLDILIEAVGQDRG
jgi:pimeloyl-ACP methyl ester carboxylesterase